MKKFIGVLVATVLATGVVVATDIEELSFMTGTWVGESGPFELEEIWNEPKAGSIQALVRMRSGEEMAMVELIVIDEHEGSLRLRIQQWDPGMEPRDTGRQTMNLVDLQDETVVFEAEDDGPLKRLTYSRKSESDFAVRVETNDGQTHEMELKNQSDKAREDEQLPPNSSESQGSSDE